MGGWFRVDVHRRAARLFTIVGGIALGLAGTSVALAGVQPTTLQTGPYLYIGGTCGDGVGGPWWPSEGAAIAYVIKVYTVDPWWKCPSPYVAGVGNWNAPPPHPDPTCGYTYPYMPLGVEGAPFGDNTDTNIEPFQLTYYSPQPQAIPGQCQAFTRTMVVSRFRNVSCPGDPHLYTWNGSECVRNGSSPDPGKNGPTCSKSAGEPCNASTGNEFQIETDYTGTGPFPLQFARTYNSISYDSAIGNTQGVLGAYWRSGYLGAFIEEVTTSSLSTAFVRRPNGTVLYFTLTGGTWTPDSDIKDMLTQTTSGWTYTLPDGTVETYDNSSDGAGTSHGKLLSITNPNGLTQTLSYDPNTGYLTSVTDPFGHSLTFTYDSQGRLSTMTDPNGYITTYGYTTDGNDNLSTVSYPDGKVKTYLYNEQQYTQNTNLPHALTGIIDENGNRYVSIYYNAAGRAIETTHPQTTNSVGQQQTTLAYTINGYGAISSTTVTDAIGNHRIMAFETNLGVQDLVSEVTEDASGNILGTVTQSFDTNNNLTCHQDADGHVTTYMYNSTNQMTSKTTGQSGSCYPSMSVNTISGVTRTTTYSYLSPTLNLLTEIDRPSVASGQTFKTVIAYGDAAHPLLPTSITQLGYTPAGVGESREVQMTYTASGQLATLTDPDGHVTTYAYNNCTTGGACGQLASITNALGQVSTFPVYDGAGNLMQQTDPNGLSALWHYDERERVNDRVDDASTGITHAIGYTYWPSGQVGTVTDGTTGLEIMDTYDAAQELSQTSDNLGDKLTYSYNPKGNLTNTDTYDPDGTLADSLGRSYDAFNHLTQVSTPDGTTQYTNDPLGNILKVVAPDQTVTGATSPDTQNQYDALNRLFQTIDRAGGITTYSYDVNDHLTQVATPNGAKTGYVVDDLGNVLQESSPDRGITTYTYDNAGNLTSRTDARGIVTDYTYDALNRLTTVVYPADSTENVTYAYDSCTDGIGRLCAVSDESGATTYAYDAFGHLAAKTHTEDKIPYTTAFNSDPLGVVQSETYPDGRVITYTRDAKERITAVTATVNGTPMTLLSNRSFRADNLVSSETWGNGLIESRVYDDAGRLQIQTVGTDTRVYGYDANGNLTSLQTIPQLDCLGYDNLDRLTQKTVLTQSGASCASPPATPDEVFSYDTNGNRTGATQSGGTTAYTYTADSNRLASIGSVNLSLDATGAITSDAAGRSFSYDNAGQLADVYQNGSLLAAYGYTARNERAMKFSATGHTHLKKFTMLLRGKRVKFSGTALTYYHYDEAGHLIDETESNGAFVKAYVWADNTPIAMITKDPTSGQEVVTYLHTDYDNTPRFATDSTGTIVWRWEGVFGATAPNPNQVQVDLRYPGQYYDAETGLHYNWNRYYDPSTGRYDQSDPMSVGEHVKTAVAAAKFQALLNVASETTWDLNPFIYAMDNAMRFTDPTGLGTVPCPPGTSTDPNCTLYDPNTPDTVLDQVQQQDNGNHCATAECGAGLLPNPPPVHLSKCEMACSFFAGKACLYTLRGGGDAGVAVYAACEVATEAACHIGCEKADQCLAKR